jgi:transcriptional regulator with XRE-family HTH domain
MLLLREKRIAQKLSVPALSRKSGVPIRTIEGIEKRDDCCVSTLAKLAFALGVSPGELIAEYAVFNENE